MTFFINDSIYPYSSTGIVKTYFPSPLGGISANLIFCLYSLSFKGSILPPFEKGGIGGISEY